MKRYEIYAAIAAALVMVSLAGCNLAGLLGLKASNPLKSLAFSAAENPSLTHDVNGLIEGTDVYLTLPYDVIEARTRLKPTVQTAADYSIQPVGAFTVSDGETIRLVETGTDQTTTYTLHVAASPETAPAPPPSSAIVSYAVTVAKNSSLVADADAVVIGTGVYITLPYAVVSADTLLTPSVTLKAGYTINPSGSYVLKDGMTLALTDTATGTTYNYVLHVAATPSNEYASGASLVESFVVTKALNPSLASDAHGIVIGSDIYISLPLADIENAVKLTPTVTLSAGYTMAPAGSYAISDGMKLTITQTATAAITDYTLHVGTNAASMAFLAVSGPFYYDASGTKQALGQPNYSLGYDPTTFTYTLTLNTDSFAGFAPYYVNDTQATISRPWGFSLVQSPYNATVTGAGAAIAGSKPPYTITVKSQDGSVAHTYTVSVVRTKSSWIGVSDVSAQATYAYTYTDSPSWDATSKANWLAAAFNSEVTNEAAFFSGGTWTGGPCGTPVVVYAPAGNNTSLMDKGLGTSGSGTATSGSTTIDLGAALDFSTGASYGDIAGGQVGTRPGTFTLAGTTTSYPTYVIQQLHGSSCGTYPTGTSASYSGTGAVTVDLTRTYSPAGYLVPTQFVIRIPAGITIESVTPILDVASSSVTTSGNDNVVSLTMGATASHLAGAVAGIICRAEDGTTKTIYVTVQ